MGIELDPHEVAEVFGDDDPTQYADEVRERWGETDAYQESHRRTSRYSKQDWLRLKAEQQDLERRFAELLASGAPATSPEARALAEEHRQAISRNYHDCSYALHRRLADLYVADERFTAHYEAVAPGLAPYVAAAVQANADARPGS